MTLFSRNNRPTTEKLAERIAALEFRRDAIADEITSAQDAITLATVNGTDATTARSKLANLEAESAGLPLAIDALRSEMRSARAEAVQATRDAERAEIVAAYDRLSKRYTALRRAVDEFNDAIGDAGPLGETRANDAAAELRIGKRLASEHYSAPIVGAIVDLDEVRRMALHRHDEVTRTRVETAGGAPDPRSRESAEAYFLDAPNGRLRPVSERPEREKVEATTTLLKRKPGGASAKAERRLPPPSLRVR